MGELRPNHLSFTKMQGVGNDFVVVDARSESGLDWAAMASQVCDRHTGIGADGLLVIDRSINADLLMRMYNPDGSSDVCGNGLRCVARYAVDRKLISSDSLTIETLTGVRAAHAFRTDNGAVTGLQVNMGSPEFAPAAVPMKAPGREVVDYPLDAGDGRRLVVSALSTGSTHCVTFVDQLPDDVTFFGVSPAVEHNPLFPQRTSLMWCVIDSESQLRLRIWERGAGETLGCGTGACAAVVAAIRHGYAAPGNPVSVVSKGGELKIKWQAGAEIQMTGPAEYVFEGEIVLSDTTGRDG